MGEVQSSEVVNRVQSSGQEHDLMHTTSDDGTVPPSAIRESITTRDNKTANTDGSGSPRPEGDLALRIEREQPGANGVASLPQALEEEPFKQDSKNG